MLSLLLSGVTVEFSSGGEKKTDLVTFINGLPLAVIELKNPANE